ncbi:MAG: hypothetical protein JWO38_4296 [Gemmataceae bacterium]|nr:hypothetical protein [Gemmataceae bacterium]
MTISRWKVMAGVLGVSLGGLAAIAGQCPKPDAMKTQRAADPLATAEAPKVSPGGSGPSAKPTGPVVPPLDLPVPAADLPSLPASPAVGPAPKLPAVPPPSVTPGQPAKPADLPALPLPADPKKSDLPKPDVIPVGASVLPALPSGPSTPVVPPTTTEPTKSAIPAAVEPPLPAGKPGAPPAVVGGPEIPKSTTVSPIGFDPLPSKPTPVEFTKPAGGPPVPAVGGVVPPTAPVISAAPPVPEPAVELTPAKPMLATAVATPAVTRFRIVLRVGEGEPMFEVRHGDDLVMKVVCEKVDIKSPEKGQGLSAVTATGKVRFVGFGAEGTCDSFSFLAGTGEVSMTGSVKVQVKDKIGRVESELTTEKMQYKLDSNAMPGVLKP